jgi:hypothetical protein
MRSTEGFGLGEKQSPKNLNKYFKNYCYRGGETGAQYDQRKVLAYARNNPQKISINTLKIIAIEGMKREPNAINGRFWIRRERIPKKSQ